MHCLSTTYLASPCADLVLERDNVLRAYIYEHSELGPVHCSLKSLAKRESEDEERERVQTLTVDYMIVLC